MTKSEQARLWGAGPGSADGSVRREQFDVELDSLPESQAGSVRHPSPPHVGVTREGTTSAFSDRTNGNPMIV